jgi:peptidyl-prolyl cis-trans isomerase D
VTDAGIENDPIDARDEGVVWYEVLGITPETLSPFEDVRSEVEKGWRQEATRNQVKAFTEKLLSELNAGSKSLEDVAKELGQEVLPTSALKRDDITVNVLPAAVQQAFSLPRGGFGSAASGVDEGRIVFKVDDIVEPPEVDPRALGQLNSRIALLYSEDIIAEYFSELEQTYGVQINRPALARLTGSGEEL